MPLYGGVSQADLSAIAALIPTASGLMPQAIGISGAAGSQILYARADHTHASSVQRTRLAVNGATVTWTFDIPYSAPPVVNGLVETPVGASQPYILVLVGQPTTTAATFAVYKANIVAVSVLGANITIFTPVTSGVTLDVMAALPTPKS